MGTYTIKIDEKTREGKSLLELLKNLKSVKIKSKQKPSRWQEMTEEEENEALGRLGQEALDDPNFEYYKIKSEEFFKEMGWK